MAKRSADEASLSNAAGSSPTASHPQKKRKSKANWKPVAVEVPGYEVSSDVTGETKESVYDHVTAYNKSKEMSLPEPPKKQKKLKSKSKPVPVIGIPSYATVEIKSKKITKRTIDETGPSDAESSTSHQQKKRKSGDISRAIAEEDDDEVVFLYEKPVKAHIERPYHEPSHDSSLEFASSPNELSTPPTAERQKEDKKLGGEEENTEVEEIEEVMGPKPAKAHTERRSRKTPTHSSLRMSAWSYNYTPPTDDSNTSNNTLAVATSPKLSLSDKAYTTTPPTTFPQFSRLPRELQDIIWALSVLPRVVPITVTEKRPVHCKRRHSRYPDPPRIGATLHCRAPIPALLHVCKDSRALGLKVYTLAFATSTSGPKVYFDFSQDTAYLQDHPRSIGSSATVMSCILHSGRDKITHLALQHNTISTNLSALPPLPALKSLSVVLHDFYDPFYESKGFSYDEMSVYSLLAPLFYNAKSSTTRSGDPATRRVMKKYELLSKEAFSDAELGRIRGSLGELGEEMEAVDVVFKVLGREGARRGLERVLGEGAFKEVADEWGKDIAKEK